MPPPLGAGAPGLDPDPVRKWKKAQEDKERDEDAAVDSESDSDLEEDAKDADYDYLLGMAMWNLTLEKKEDLLKKKQENFDNWIDRDPEIKCYLPGVPRANYMPYPFQVFQNEGNFFIAYEYANAVRDIYMEDPGEAPVDSWMGWSHGTWDGGREKAPAAMCRKVLEAQMSGDLSINIWGDGEQTRSFMYIDDCIEGILRIHDGHFVDPINLGSSELVSINQLVDTVQSIAGIDVERAHDLDAPKGVRGRNSDNTLIRSVFDWEPSTSLREGLEHTYAWIEEQVATSVSGPIQQPWRASSSSTSTTGRTSRAQANT